MFSSIYVRMQVFIFVFIIVCLIIQNLELIIYSASFHLNCLLTFARPSFSVTSQLSTWIHDQRVASPEEYFFLDCNKMIFPFPTIASTAAYKSTASPASTTIVPPATAQFATPTTTAISSETTLRVRM